MAGLGKGLSALISENTAAGVKGASGFISNLPINKVVPNPFQPRVEFNPEQLVELADSIREHGFIEPLLVSKKDGNTYELIAGERRLRAAQLAGIEYVPVVVREASPQEMLELAVIENVQRADLNPLEEAMAFEQLTQVFDLSHDQIAKKVGLSRPAVANKIRLLGLPDEIKTGLIKNQISEGHARALLGLDSVEKMLATFQITVRDHLSVRALEELVRRVGKEKTAPGKAIKLDNATLEIEKKLKAFISNKLTISRSTKGGKIVIPFSNDDQLNELTTKLTATP